MKFNKIMRTKDFNETQNCFVNQNSDETQNIYF